jgi:hypothetical protein
MIFLLIDNLLEIKMKKTANWTIPAIIFILFIGLNFAVAQDNTTKKDKKAETSKTTSNSPTFVDADGDGVCDNHANKKGCCNHKKKQANFIDTDGDGVCDKHADGKKGSGHSNCNHGNGNHGHGKCDGSGKAKGK